MPEIVEIEDITSDVENDDSEEGVDEGLDDDDDYDEDWEYRPELDLEEVEDDESDDDGAIEEAEAEVGQYIRGLGPLPPRGGQAGSRQEEKSKEESARWQGLTQFPAATKTQYVDLLKKLKALKKTDLTILMLGKHFAGKSNLVNSILNEEVASKQFLNRDPTPVKTFTRAAQGLTLNIIDAGAPTELDRFSASKMQQIVSSIDDRQVDAVLYVDRFDVFRTDGADRQLIEGVTRALGPSIWANAIICLTRASSSTNGLPFGEFAEKRSEKLRQAIRKYGRNQSASLPAACVENDESCEQNSEGERILPDKKPWLSLLIQKIADIAENTEPYSYNPKQIEKSTNPNKQMRWLVPIAFIAQIAVKKFVLDPILQDDYHTGDKNGPFDANIVKGRRAIAKLEKEGKVKKGTLSKQPTRRKKI